VSNHEHAVPGGKAHISEDWLALIIGLFVFLLSLLQFAGVDILGWAVTTCIWTNLATALKPASKTCAGLPALVSLGLTWLFLLAIMSVGRD
jgi:hypothetical protein